MKRYRIEGERLSPAECREVSSNMRETRAFYRLRGNIKTGLRAHRRQRNLVAPRFVTYRTRWEKNKMAPIWKKEGESPRFWAVYRRGIQSMCLMAGIRTATNRRNKKERDL